MKTKKANFVVLLLATVIALPTQAVSSSINLQWDASPDPEVTGYKVYYQPNSAAVPFVGAAAMDVQNATTATINDLDPANPYYFAVTGYTADGDETEYSNVYAMPETLPPSVTITSPANLSPVQGVVAITTTATDNVGVSKVELYVNNVLALTTTAAPYSFSWDTSALSNGTYSVMAKAYDGAGNMGESQTVSFLVGGDVVPPTATLSVPTGTAIGSILMTASASDDVGVTKIEIYDNQFLIFASNTVPASYLWNTSQASNGIHSLTAKAYDNAGNVGQSASVAVTVLNDTAAPSVSIASPVGGTVGGDVAVSANASDDVAVNKVEFYVNGNLEATSTTAPYSFNWNSTSVPNGSCTLSTKAYDAAGNVGQSANVAVTVFNDSTAPAVSIASPIGGTVGGTVAVSANASDNVAVTRVEFYLNGALQTTVTGAPYSYGWNTAAVANGSYTLSARAYDAAGNVGQSADVAVTVFNDTVAPTVSIASPAGGSVTGSVPVSANASDNVAVTKVEFYLNGTLQTVSQNAPYGFTWNSAAVPNGSYTLTAKAYDAAGNVGQAAGVVFTVVNDSTAPAVSILSPANSSNVKGNNTNISAQATDNVGVTRMELYIDSDPYPKYTTTGSFFKYGYSFSYGVHTVTVKAYDAAKNVTASTVTVNRR